MVDTTVSLPSPTEQVIEIYTSLGCIAIKLRPRRAPYSCAYILSLIERGRLSNSSVFRVVTVENHASPHLPCVEVAQFGHRCDDPNVPIVLPHESTAQTGLRHVRGTASLPRYRPGAVYESFFICFRDEPCLDYGGNRNPDHQGFAAFGSVVAGWPVLETIYALAGDDEYPADPVRISATTAPTSWRKRITRQRRPR